MNDDMENNNVPIMSPKINSRNIAQNRAAEDLIFNKFLDENIGINLGNLTDLSDTKYMSSKQIDKDNYSRIAYTIISNDYQKDIEEHNRFENLGFNRYVKIWNNSNEYLQELRQNPRPSKSDPAHIFYDVFAGDPGLFKAAALEGYKLHLEETMENA